MVFKKDLIKLKKKYKIHTIRKDIKNLKYVKTIKMYKILTQIHLNYKFKKITFKNNQIHGLSDCLAIREAKSLMAWNSHMHVVCELAGILSYIYM